MGRLCVRQRGLTGEMEGREEQGRTGMEVRGDHVRLD